jgi:phenylalanyl-tRNA synthetase alpha chain
MLKIDITAPGKKAENGGVHPITKEIRKMEEIFQSLGFEIADGP